MEVSTKLFCVAVTVLLQCHCGVAGSTDKMTFAYKEDKFKGVMDFRFVYADGPIVTETAKEFVSFIRSKQIAAGAVVFLNSPGGLVSEALQLGRAIRASRYNCRRTARTSLRQRRMLQRLHVGFPRWRKSNNSRERNLWCTSVFY